MEGIPTGAYKAEVNTRSEAILSHNGLFHSGKPNSDLEDCSRDPYLPDDYVCPFSVLGQYLSDKQYEDTKPPNEV